MVANAGKGGPGSSPAGSLRAKPVDMHVHVVGNGSGGSGCWLQLRAWQRPLVELMLRTVGLPRRALREDLERLYVDRLLEMVRGSSLGAVVILAQDRPYDKVGKAVEGAGCFYVPNDYVLQLGRRHREFLPAVSIHPGRPDAMEELERCLEGGAVMMKCLPNCQNIDCNDRRFVAFWERMAEAGLPLLAHTGGEHTLPVLRPDLSHPRVLALPLECGVKVIAAHCATRSGLFDRDYFRDFVEMTRRYPGLYGDNSAFNVPTRNRHVRECLGGCLEEKIVHGSDFPIPVHGHGAWLRGLVGWAAFRKCERLSNVLERDCQLKLAMGFSPASFTRIWGLLRLASEKVSC